MINVWLYASDGRALYFVSVPTPMPMVVNYAGLVFGWDAGKSRYIQSSPVPPYPGPYYSASPASEESQSQSPSSD